MDDLKITRVSEVEFKLARVEGVIDACEMLSKIYNNPLDVQESILKAYKEIKDIVKEENDND